MFWSIKWCLGGFQPPDLINLMHIFFFFHFKNAGVNHKLMMCHTLLRQHFSFCDMLKTRFSWVSLASQSVKYGSSDHRQLLPNRLPLEPNSLVYSFCH